MNHCAVWGRYAKLVNGSVRRITRGCVVGVSMVAGVLCRLGLRLSVGRLAARPSSLG
jgi:hypothetical protein